MAHTPTLLIDLLSLEAEVEEKERIDVRCMKCFGRILFRRNYTDFVKSYYQCNDTWCDFSVGRLEAFDPRAYLGRWFFTATPSPPASLQKLDLVENVGKTAFHRCRPATLKEEDDFVLNELQLMRQAVAKQLGVKL